MTVTLDMAPADEAFIAACAARENISVPDFIRRAVKESIERRAHVPRPKARDEMTDEELVAMIDQSLEEARQGKTAPLEEVFAELREELAAYDV